MTKLIYAPGALKDIDGIWDYTVEKWGIEQARFYTGKIESTCQSIASGEKRLKSFEDLPEISGYVRCEHHYIFVVKDSEATNIVSVLHERMDILDHLVNRLDRE